MFLKQNWIYGITITRVRIRVMSFELFSPTELRLMKSILHRVKVLDVQIRLVSNVSHFTSESGNDKFNVLVQILLRSVKFIEKRTNKSNSRFIFTSHYRNI